ncbi:10639_t:CDS:1 [Funneliformis mosseae]|uniref:10639_t:CDS:1 n=1 Tax=Funneliformis mosseae TaxID=27381 RepID=A0A9N9AVW7_FUNMO|nr:10639_t:CDS:1 [Funneliformis mosseae]
MLGIYIKGSKRGGEIVNFIKNDLIKNYDDQNHRTCIGEKQNRSTETFFPRISLDSSECSDVRKCMGQKIDKDTPCSSKKTLELIREFGQDNSFLNGHKAVHNNASQTIPWFQIYKKTDCNSESCVLNKPSFQKFAESKGFGSRFLDRELDINFKAYSPRDSTAWLSNRNIDETLQRWVHKFNDFYPCPFTMVDFEERKERFATIDMIGVLEGDEPVDLGPEIGIKKRPHKTFDVV